MSSTDLQNSTTMAETDEKHTIVHQHPAEDESATSEVSMIQIFSKKGIALSWMTLLVIALMNSFDSVAVNTFQIYAVSEYKRLSIEGALATALGVATIVLQAPLAVFINHSSVFKIFAFSTVITTLGAVLQAATPNIGGFLAGYILNSLGTMITRFLMFITATSLSTLQYRGLALAGVNIPGIISLLGGAPMAQSALLNLGWRWGYGIWAVLVPVISPLFLATLYIYKQRKAARTENSTSSRTRMLWATLLNQDYIGICLLVAGNCLFLLPIPLEQGGVSAYGHASVVAPTVIGFVLIILFGVWEVFWAKNPIAPRRLLANRTVMGAICANMFQYMSFTVAMTYFFTYIMVCSDMSISHGTYISYVYVLVAQVLGLGYGFLIAGFKQPKWFFLGGTAIALLGRGLHYAFMDPHTQLTGLIMSQVVFGIGFGNNMQALTIAQAEAASSRDYPVIIALTFIICNIGVSVGGAIVGAVWTTTLPAQLQAVLPLELKDKAMLIMNSLPVAQSFPLGSEARTGILEAYSDVFHIILLIAIVIQAVALIICFAIRNVSVDDSRHDGTQAVNFEKKEGNTDEIV